MIPTLPLKPRNRLAEMILAAFHDGRAREELEALARAPDDRAPDDWLSADERQHAPLLIARARRAARALRDHAPTLRGASIDQALAHAKILFDAGLHFEVHELLEPHWRDATGERREALQGLIQIAVGYQHLANGNLRGAESLLDEGVARIRRGRLPDLDLAGFASRVAAMMPLLPDVRAGKIPQFPASAGTYPAP